jgi:hypothetical protein
LPASLWQGNAFIAVVLASNISSIICCFCHLLLLFLQAT